MELKTKVIAIDNTQNILITRQFDLPVALLFKAYTTPEIVAQWMGTKVLLLENKKFGAYHFETTDPMGNIHTFTGAIHEYIFNSKITRTFHMENTAFPVQLEFLSFEELDPRTSQLQIQIVFKSLTDRDNLLKMPFAQGINWAHNRLQEILTNSTE